MSYGCVICSEVFSSTDDVNNYPVCMKGCAHVFHNACLRQWLEKSETCPVCRRPTCATCVFRLHLMSVNNLDGSFLPTTMKRKESEDLRKEVEELRRYKKKVTSYLSKTTEIFKLHKELKLEFELGLKTGAENDSVIDLTDDPPAQVAIPPVVVPPVLTRATRGSRVAAGANRKRVKVIRRRLFTLAYRRTLKRSQLQ